MPNKKDVKIFDDLINIFPERLKSFLLAIPDEIKSAALEIRVNKKIRVFHGKSFLSLSPEVSAQDISEIFKKLCGYSVYSFQEQLKNGFVTFPGGHRVGIASSAVLENGEITAIKEISSLNLRIAREFKNCSKNIYEIIKKSSKGALIVGPPLSGKTTILRDLARLFSSENKVTIVDERFEIAACNEGKTEMDVGSSDVLSGFPKPEGILRAVRCLSPNVVICDEIGTFKEAKAINEVLNSGVKIIASIHASSEKEILKKPQILWLLYSGAFEKIVILSSVLTGNAEKFLDVSEVVRSEDFRNNFSCFCRGNGWNGLLAAQP